MGVSGSGVSGIPFTVDASGDVAFAGALSQDGNTSAAGVGITAGSGTLFGSGVERIGTMFKTTIIVDLTGLNSKNTDLDIIGVDGTGVAHLGQITAALNGTIFMGNMRCIELPAGGDPNISLYSAAEATGVEDTLISALTETLLLNSQGDGTDWAAGDDINIATFPAANEYLYLVQGDATGTDGTYTAGKFIIEFWGV